MYFFVVGKFYTWYQGYCLGKLVVDIKELLEFGWNGRLKTVAEFFDSVFCYRILDSRLLICEKLRIHNLKNDTVGIQNVKKESDSA